MRLAPGTRLGPYEVTGSLGSGGMGEVYRARDTRLDRIVAIKILPAELSTDPDPAGSASSHAKSKADRLARFEREARAIAALAHPHICTLFDVGEAVPSSHESAAAGHRDGRIPNPESPIPSPGPVHYLVMEYLDGQTLADRLSRGALPPGQVLEIATQIADALDAAHRQGVIHRDLKPGNVMLVAGGPARAEGATAKLLDFGLARLTERGGGPADGGAAAAPTLTDSLTMRGTVMGTLPYMAPELLEGRPADARSDLWALGAMIYEMLTGRRAFAGDSQASLIGSIMSSEPPALAETQPLAPPALEHVVRKCLAKRPDHRWDSAHDVADELRWIAGAGTGTPAVPAAAAAPRRRRWLVHAAWAAACVALLAVLARQYFRDVPVSDVDTARHAASPQIVHMDVVVPADLPFWFDPQGAPASLALAPDGSSMAYSCGRGASTRLCVRHFGRNEVAPIPGTDGARFPVYSADGRSIVFCPSTDSACPAGGPIRKLTVADGRIETLGEIPATLRSLVSLSWLDDDRIMLSGAGGVWTMPASGGSAVPLVRVDEAGGEAGFFYPALLPDDRLLIGTFARFTPRLVYKLGSVSLDTGARRIIREHVCRPWYLPTGHLLYYDLALASTMVAALDTESLTLGPPVTLWEPVRTSLSKPSLAFSSSGTLIYLPALGDRVLTWVDRERRAVPALPEQASWGAVSLHPDGRRAAVEVLPQRGASSIVLVDLIRGISTPAASSAVNPVWTRDGSRFAFVSEPFLDSVLWKAADGSGAPETLRQGTEEILGSWSRDGHLAYSTKNGQTGAFEIALLARADAGWQARRLLPAEREPSQHSYAAPRFSPDGRWLAYNSNETGRWEVYVNAYPGGGARTRVSGGGGYHPVWSRDGRELFYRSEDRFFAVSVSPASSLVLGAPREIFSGPYLDSGPLNPPDYDVSPDGRRFLVVRVSDEERAPTRFHLVQNWFEEVKARVPAEPDNDMIDAGETAAKERRRR